ncbi:MAG: hypothetical protein Q7I97_02930 [Thermovirgaceae bacterium]|nr:hypothetical protein [Thermovirgaceae bacterium]
MQKNRFIPPRLLLFSGFAEVAVSGEDGEQTGKILRKADPAMYSMQDSS